jgi:hypothetical protein
MPTRKLGPMTVKEGVEALVESHFMPRDWAVHAMTAAIMRGRFHAHLEDYSLLIEKVLTEQGNVYVFTITPDAD